LRFKLNVWLGFGLLIPAVIFSYVRLSCAAVEGSAGINSSGSWSDGAGAYNAGNYSFPTGYSKPVLPSFSKNSITPFYYFDRPMRVNSAGFTTMTGSFTNPAAIAYTTLSNNKSFQPSNLSADYHGTPVWFHNGLDGIAFHHQSVFAGRIDQSYIKGLGLDNVTPAGRQTEIYYSDGTRLQTREIYKTATGLEIDYAAVQSQEFINENLNNMKQGKYSTVNERYDSDEALSNAAAQVNYYSLGGGSVIMAVNSPKDFFHWNYSSGAYVQPGDILYYEGKQKIEGFGATEEFRKLDYYVHGTTKKGIGMVDVSGNFISTEGHVKNLPNEIKWGQLGPTLFGKKREASFLNGYVEPSCLIMVKYDRFKKEAFGLTTEIPLSLTFENKGGEWDFKDYNLPEKMSQRYGRKIRDIEINIDFPNPFRLILSGEKIYYTSEPIPISKETFQDEADSQMVTDKAERELGPDNCPRWNTWEKDKYLYYSVSASGKPEKFMTIGMGYEKGLLVMPEVSYSPMFSDVKHSFKNNFDKFVSGVQEDDKKYVFAVGDYEESTDRFLSLKRKTAYINKQGFVEINGSDSFKSLAVSGGNNLNLNGSFFEGVSYYDFKDKTKIEAVAERSTAGLNDVFFLVSQGGRDWLKFQVGAIEIAGRKYDSSNGLLCGVAPEFFGQDDSLAVIRQPYISITPGKEENFPLILFQESGDVFDDTESLPEPMEQDLSNRGEIKKNLPYRDDRLKDENEILRRELTLQEVQGEKSIVCAQGTQRIKLLMANLNSPYLVLSGDFRNVFLNNTAQFSRIDIGAVTYNYPDLGVIYLFPRGKNVISFNLYGQMNTKGVGEGLYNVPQRWDGVVEKAVKLENLSDVAIVANALFYEIDGTEELKDEDCDTEEEVENLARKFLPKLQELDKGGKVFYQREPGQIKAGSVSWERVLMETADDKNKICIPVGYHYDNIFANELKFSDGSNLEYGSGRVKNADEKEIANPSIILFKQCPLMGTKDIAEVTALRKMQAKGELIEDNGYLYTREQELIYLNRNLFSPTASVSLDLSGISLEKVALLKKIFLSPTLRDFLSNLEPITIQTIDINGKKVEICFVNNFQGNVMGEYKNGVVKIYTKGIYELSKKRNSDFETGLKEIVTHEIAHGIIEMNFNESVKDKVTKAIDEYSIYGSVVTTFFSGWNYSILHELGAYLITLAYSSQPNENREKVRRVLLCNSLSHSVASETVNRMLFEKLGGIEYLIGTEIANKKTENKGVVSIEGQELIRQKVLKEYRDGTYYTNHPLFNKFFSTVSDKSINDTARKCYQEIYGKFPQISLPGVPKEVFDAVGITLPKIK